MCDRPKRLAYVGRVCDIAVGGEEKGADARGVTCVAVGGVEAVWGAAEIKMPLEGVVCTDLGRECVRALVEVVEDFLFSVGQLLEFGLYSVPYVVVVLFVFLLVPEHRDVMCVVCYAMLCSVGPTAWMCAMLSLAI